MHTLLKRADDVKNILISFDPYTGKYAAFLATEHELIVVPIVARTIDPFSLLYRPGEIDDQEASVHEAGFIAFFLGDSVVKVPLKDLPGLPFHRSIPADFQVALVDFDQPVKIRGIGATDTLLSLWRPVQPGEITDREISHIHTVMRTREKEKESGLDPVGQTPTRGQDKKHLHIVPDQPEPAEIPEPEKPTATTLKRSVGRTRKFAYLPPRIMELMEVDGLSIRDIETYRFLYTFRKYPEMTRIRAKGKGPADRFPYSITYQSQISNGLEVRKSDLLATARGHRRNRAQQMGTSRRSVQRAIHRLCESGWILRVYPGRPKDCPWLSAREQDRRIQRHDRVPQWGPQKHFVATDKCQRDLLKGLTRKLKKLRLPPFLIYLKDLWL